MVHFAFTMYSTCGYLKENQVLKTAPCHEANASLMQLAKVYTITKGTGSVHAQCSSAYESNQLYVKQYLCRTFPILTLFHDTRIFIKYMYQQFKLPMEIKDHAYIQLKIFTIFS